MLRQLGGAVLVGATAYMAADAAADSLLYMRAKGLVMDQAQANERFKEQLGEPLQAGPWYNSSVAVAADGHLASVTLPVRGTLRSSDVTLRVVRKGGLRSTLLYNLAGGAEWEVLVMNALIGMGPGGRPVSMSLLEQEEPDMAAAAADAVALGHGECLPGVPQVPAALAVQQQGQQGQAQQQAGAAVQGPAMR